MDYYIKSENLADYIILPKTFDWDLVDQENGFKKIFKIFPEEKYLELKTSHEEIFRLLTKSAVHYSFILAIPKIKVHINSTGVNQFDQDKLKTAPWWDVRDLGLSLLKVADSLFSEAITLAGKDETLVSELDFFKNGISIIKTPADFENIYSINSSPEVFEMLQQFLKQAIKIKIVPKIGTCLDLVSENPELQDFLKQAIAFYALNYASLFPSFVFLQNAVVVQYEELPWQKSQVLDVNAKAISGQNFKQMGDEILKIITDYIKANPENFPCYVAPENEMNMRATGYGISLL